MRLRDGAELLEEVGLFLREVRFHNLGISFALAQEVITLIDRDPLEPSLKGSFQAKLGEREVKFGKDFLGDVFYVTGRSHDLINEPENPSFKLLQEQLEGGLVTLLAALDKFLVGPNQLWPSGLDHLRHCP